MGPAARTGSVLRSARHTAAIAFRDDHFDTAVLLAPRRALVVGHGRAFPKSASLNAIARYDHACQCIAHGTGTSLRKTLIVVICADAVGEAFNLDAALRIFMQEC